MKIALCISGQPRFWDRCFESWINSIFPGTQKDIFFHFWDYNTLPSGSGNNSFNLIDEKEKTSILEKLNPKKHVFDNRHVNPTGPQVIPPTKFVSTPIGWWCHSQYYSMWYASRLKRQYELEHKFEYDGVFRLRSDLVLTDPINEHSLEFNTVYTVGNQYVAQHNRFMVADTFFYADSFTFDQVSEYYFALKFIDRYDVSEGTYEPPPEIGFYPFIKSRGIKNKYASVRHKLVRDAEYLKYKKKLGKYEIL
jgi:hypothetical protein